jgi:hypothetical protein
MKRFALTIVTFAAAMCTHVALAGGPLDPDCTAEKAAKGAAAKATVGVGGRCSAGEAAKDSTKEAVGVKDKGPIEKRRDDDKPADAAKGAVKKAVN